MIPESLTCRQLSGGGDLNPASRSKQVAGSVPPVCGEELQTLA